MTFESWECINYSKQVTKETVLNPLKQRTGRGQGYFSLIKKKKNKAWRQDAYHTKLREKKMKCQQGKWRLSRRRKWTISSNAAKGCR